MKTLSKSPEWKLNDIIELINLASPCAVDRDKLIETYWIILMGHSEKAIDLFTKERIFWLMDNGAKTSPNSPRSLK